MSGPVSDDARYAALLAARAADPWEPSTSLPWAAPVQPPRWLPRRTFVRAISQLFHGEAATAAVCARLAGEVAAAQPLAAECLRAQADDELRHADVFARYLERLGGPVRIDPPLAAGIALASADDLPPLARVVAFNILLEGEAVQLLHAFARHVSCPLLGAIVHRISRDEARHVAFGKRFVASAAAALSDRDRAVIAARIAPIWRSCGPELFAVYAGPFGAWVGRGAARQRWARHVEALNRLGVPVAADADRR